jgi:hypothetical protein
MTPDINYLLIIVILLPLLSGTSCAANHLKISEIKELLINGLNNIKDAFPGFAVGRNRYIRLFTPVFPRKKYFQN